MNDRMRVFVCARICMHECAGVHGSKGREIGTNVENKVGKNQPKYVSASDLNRSSQRNEAFSAIFWLFSPSSHLSVFHPCLPWELKKT